MASGAVGLFLNDRPNCQTVVTTTVGLEQSSVGLGPAWPKWNTNVRVS